MVSPADLKAYKSAGGGLGGAIDTSAPVIHNTSNNYFRNSTAAEAATGKDYYGCMFLKNIHASEDMDEFRLWEDSDSPGPETTYKWALDPLVLGGAGYRWSPFFTGDGATTFDSTADAPQYQLPEFTLAVWFKTTASGLEMMMVNKGGLGSDTAGQNDNYSIRMSSANKITFGFEETTGTDHYAVSPLSYNNGLWHLAVGTYGGANLNLYVDDMVTPVATIATSTSPELNAQPVVVGRNSRASDRFWSGQLDEPRIWDHAIGEASRVNLLNNVVIQTGLVFEKKFGADDGAYVTQTIVNEFTAPLNVTWQTAGVKPALPTLVKLKFGKSFPVWLWKHVAAGSQPKTDTPDLFAFTFKIPAGGTGTPGGGGGGSGGTPPPAVADYKIAFVGDEGCESETDDVKDLIQSQNYDFVWSVGDHSYDGSASCWINRFNPLKPLFDSAYGNHEYEESAGINPYKTFFAHNKTYFSRKIQNILFVVADTNINCDPGSAQHNLIKAALEAADNDASIVWKIAVMHHPWFGSSSQHSYNDASQVEAFHELFEQHRVSFVVTGHNHNFQRSKQVGFNSSNPESPTVVSGTSPYSRDVSAIIHVISGTGGHDSVGNLYSLGSQPSFLAYQNKTHNGIWEIIASNGGNTLTCQFREIGGDTFDQFVINA